MCVLLSTITRDNMARWRTWDIDCVEETLETRPDESEIKPLVLLGSLKEISLVSLSSIVLPKEALISSTNHTGKKARGRGRSLANRALGFDKPSRRPGESSFPDTKPSQQKTLRSQFLGSEYLYDELFPSLQNASTKDSKPSSTKLKSKKWPALPPVKSAQQKANVQESFTEKPRQHRRDIDTNDREDQTKMSSSAIYDTNIPDHSADEKDESTSPSSNTYNTRDVFSPVAKDTSNNKDQIQLPSLAFYSNASNAKISSFDEPIEQQAQSIDSQESDGIKDYWDSDEENLFNTIVNKESLPLTSTNESFEAYHDKPPDYKLGYEEDENPNKPNEKKQPQLSFCLENNFKWTGRDQLRTEEDQYSGNPSDNSHRNNKDRFCGEDRENHTDPSEGCQDEEDKTLGLNKEQLNLTDDIQEDYEDNEQALENGIVCKHLINETSVCDKIEQVQVMDVGAFAIDEEKFMNDTLPPMQGGNTEVSKTDTSCSKADLNCQDNEFGMPIEINVSTESLSTNEDMEPCHVLLENLPLAFTEEELQEIVEPYGEMLSYSFKERDDTTKACILKMANFMSGELLKVSTDGLEIDGCRIKAEIVDEDL